MIFDLLLSAVLLLVKIVLYPIDLLISAVLPDFSAGMVAVGEFIVYSAQGLGWAISAAGIPFGALSLIATFYIFKLTLPINIWIIKLAVKWYKSLKP